MNTLLIQGDWNILKGKLKQTWARFTHDEDTFIEGESDEFLGRIQKKTGEKRTALKRAKRERDELRYQTDRFLEWLTFSDRCAGHGTTRRKDACC